MRKYVDNGPMLNAYPDSMGGTLSDIAGLLEREEMKDVFQSFYILPSVYNSDLDRGFSVIDYGINELLASREDLCRLERLGLDLKLDFVLNHASVLSLQFQDLLQKGGNSVYKDFFIDWNRFWEGCGEMTEDGYMQPYPQLIENMFFRKEGLPILMVRMPDGKKVPYWNTFYQEIRYPRIEEQELMRALNLQYPVAAALADLLNGAIEKGEKPSETAFGRLEEYKQRAVDFLESKRTYLGQMDLNIKSPLVWEYYGDTLKTLAGYGAKIVRLDAFAYASKEPGEKNFLNDPGTWTLLEGIKKLASPWNLTLLPEIHAGYEEKIYQLVAQKGYMVYDFFLPGLIIDALEEKNGESLAGWALELYEKRIRTVNMLGCHDGIPLLDLKGLIPQERIERLIETVVKRGGFVKNLHGQKNAYYQVNAAYYSALGEDENRLLLARALQLFMPGKPQIWYLDLFLGTNDYEAMEKAGPGGHKEINRTNLTKEQIRERMGHWAVRQQLSMLRFRNTFPAFGFDGKLELHQKGSRLRFVWRREGYQALLDAQLDTCQFAMKGLDGQGREVWSMGNL